MKRVSNQGGASVLYNDALIYEPLTPMRRQINGKIFLRLQNPPKKHKRLNK